MSVKAIALIGDIPFFIIHYRAFHKCKTYIGTSIYWYVSMNMFLPSSYRKLWHKRLIRIICLLKSVTDRCCYNLKISSKNCEAKSDSSIFCIIFYPLQSYWKWIVWMGIKMNQVNNSSCFYSNWNSSLNKNFLFEQIRQKMKEWIIEVA